jgi:hypothetical protein
MKTKRFFIVGLPAVLRALGLVVAASLMLAGCGDDDDGGDGGASDPISVDLSLPSIQDVPAFTGTFVVSEEESKDLVIAAFGGIGGVSPSSSQGSTNNSVQSLSRSVQEENPLEIYDRNTTIIPGAEVTGFIQGRQVQSLADDNNPGESVGDSMETSLRVKLAVDFQNVVTQDNFAIKGKYTVDEDLYMKVQVTSVSPSEGDLTMRYAVSDGYAISISKDGKGLKFVMRLQGNLNKNIKGDESAFDEFDTGNSFDTYSLSLEVYDNDNVKNDAFSQTFASYGEAAAYLGIAD